jgi:hypothetical protein|tara:strand:- start:1251 stop:1877 length:627 start_codon:yes stop_codon:yes gene_type:complete
MKLSPIIFLLLLSSFAYSQNIGLQYYSTKSGRNITLTFSKTINKSLIGLGLGYNINSMKQPDDQNNVYHKRLFATKPIQHLNFNFFYNRKVLNQLKNIQPFVFYDFQLKHSTTRTRSFLPHSYDSTETYNKPEEGILYKEYIENFGPFTWLENNIGVGFEVNIYNKLYLNQKAGFGATFIFGPEPKLLKTRAVMELNFFLSIGINYKL